MAATRTIGDSKTYSTIMTAVNATPGNLSGQGIQTLEVYPKAPNDRYAENLDVVTGFSNASGSDRIIIIAMQSHGGLSQDAGGTGIMIDLQFSGVLGNYIDLFDYTTFEGFEITTIGGIGAGNAFLINGKANSVIRNNILHDITAIGTNYHGGINTDGANVQVYNNTVYNLTGARSVGVGLNGTAGIFMRGSASNCEVWNNTVYNIINTGNSAGNGFLETAARATYRNNYSGSSSFLDFNVTSEDYCVSSDASATGGNSQINKAAIDQFVSIGIGTEDFSIKNNSAAIFRKGVSAGQLSADDIIGFSWESPPSNGAFEFITSATDIDSSAAQNPIIIEGSNDNYVLNIGFTKAEILFHDADVTQIDIDITGTVGAGEVTNVRVYISSDTVFDNPGDVLFGSDNNGGAGWGNGDTVSITGLVVPTVATLYFLIVLDVAVGTLGKTVGCTVVNTTYFTATDDVIDNGGLPATQSPIVIASSPDGETIPLPTRGVIGSQLFVDGFSL